MNAATYNAIAAWFDGYTKSFADSAGKLHELIQMKFEHSKRVADDCRIIAAELGWSEEQSYTAGALGLLHDVSRYEQFTRYRTFLDRKSFNHGARSSVMIRTSPVAGLCTPEDLAVLLDGAGYHNRKTVPADVAATSLPFVKIIRDADKLDILSIVNTAVRTNRILDYPEIVLGIDLNGPPTKELVSEILESGQGSFENLRSLVDMHIIRIAWVYDVNYVATLKLMTDRGLLAELYSFIPDLPDLNEIVSRARKFVAGRLSTTTV